MKMKKPTHLEIDRGFETTCHIWQGTISNQGYARYENDSGTVLVHRQTWIEANGAIPAGHDVHHRCEQTDCVRVSHLDLRSRSDHIRAHRGVSPEKYQSICAAIRSGEESQAGIARRFGVSKSYIWELRLRLLAGQT